MTSKESTTLRPPLQWGAPRQPVLLPLLSGRLRKTDKQREEFGSKSGRLSNPFQDCRATRGIAIRRRMSIWILNGAALSGICNTYKVMLL